ncbi:glycosyl transferase [Verrucomicrobiota bacterium]|nr:glycosyl transferase [Verrucomicrobiota bacterium]
MNRVLFVDHVDRILGGAQVNLLELLPELLAEPSLRVACACAPAGPLSQRLRELGVEQFPHQLPAAAGALRVVGRGFSFFNALRAHAALREAQRELEKTLAAFQPSAVISIPNKDHFCAAAACRSAGVPSVWWVNDIVSAQFFSRLVRAVFLFRARRSAAQVVVVSDYARRALLDQGLPAAKVRTIHNGIPLARYARTTPGHLHRLLNLPQDEPLAGIVGRFTPWKGQDFFLRLAERWMRENPRGHFVLVGQAFNEEQAFEAELKQFVSAHGLGARVHFVPFQSDAPAVFSDLSVLLHCSTSPEPFGRVIVEAMAAGTPVIAARDGGVPEIITDGVDGFLAPPGDLDAYLAALRRVWSGPPAAALSAAARRTVAERFSITRVKTEFQKLIADVTAAA